MRTGRGAGAPGSRRRPALPGRGIWIGALLAAAACQASARGPAWPRSAGAHAVPLDDWKEDGGQSLAPAGGAALEASADRREVVAALPEPSPERATTPAAAGETTTPITDQELQEALDAIELQETIVIEIDD